MKRYTRILAAAAVAAAVSATSFAAATDAVALKDIDNYWGKTAIQYFYDNHYINGTNGYFHPNDVLTREGVAAIVNNMIGNDTTSTTTFSDVKGRWSARAIGSLVDKRIMSGYSDGSFQPAQAITREEFAVIAYNYLNYKGVGTNDVTAAPFNDESQISTWARKPVGVLSSLGYIKGNNNLFHPKEQITRGEAVSILYRMMTGTKVESDSKSQIETTAFSDITSVYDSIKNFASDGIMYWQGSKLHIGVKNEKKRDQLTAAIAGDNKLPADTVVVQRANYGYNDYKSLMENAEKTYRATEGTDAEVKTDVDYLNEQVLLMVNSISKETQQALNKKYGNSIKIVIQ